MLSLFGVPVPNAPAGAGAGPAFGAGPRSGWPGWSYEGAHEGITLGERHRGKRGVLSAPRDVGRGRLSPRGEGVVDRFPLTARPVLAEAGRWRGGFPRRSFGPSRSRGAVILPPGHAEAEIAGARRGPFRRSPGPGRDGAGSRPGDLVPDSSAGSGTALMAAVSLVSRAIGVDRSLEAPKAFWPKAEKGPRLQVLRASFG
jgi:hypothetical protein